MGAKAIKSEITGTVTQIEVREGDAVEEDQALIIFESMKMEIPLVALESCVVTSVLVAEGQVVQEGQDVVIVEYR